MQVLLSQGKDIRISLSQQELEFIDREANENGISVEEAVYGVIGLLFIMKYKSLIGKE